MTNVALILPVPHLETHGMMNRIHMILPSLLTNEKYHNYYRSRAVGHKILDNGEAEGDTFSPPTLIGYGMALGVNEIVCPDVIGDMYGTIERTKAFLPHTVKGFQYMGVVQGTSPSEVQQCITELADMRWIHTLGIPRALCKHMGLHARIDVIDQFESLISNYFAAVHFLGASSWWEEVRHLNGHPVPVRSIDTSLPAVLAMKGIDIENEVPSSLRSLEEAGKRPVDFFEWQAVNSWFLAHNCSVYQDWGIHGFNG